MSSISTIYLLMCEEESLQGVIMKDINAAVVHDGVNPMTEVSRHFGGGKHAQHSCWVGSFNRPDYQALVHAFFFATELMKNPMEAKMLIWDEYGEFFVIAPFGPFETVACDPVSAVSLLMEGV